ncbi:MAG: SRPBCC family protein [Chloroflexota bacterium]
METSTAYYLSTEPVTQTAMLIRRPAAEVFEAFVDPEITTKFWFTRSSGRLEAGKQVRWEWEMYGASALVDVKEIEPGQRIVIEWSDGDPSTVEWQFTPLAEDRTFVNITHSGFSGDGDELVVQALDSTGGFTLVLAGLKALLEHGVELNLVGDRFPAELQHQD